MPINYAEKYSSQIDECFKIGALTAAAINDDYEFSGVNKVKVYSIPTVPLNNYSMEGTNRYGTPVELGNDIQEFTLTQDKSFTFAIDRRNSSDTMQANSAAAALNRELDEVVIPTVDKYRLLRMAQNAGKTVKQVVGRLNAYEAMLEASAYLTDKKIPVNGRIAFVTPGFFKELKLDSKFINASDKAQEIKFNGMVAAVDNISIISCPTDYFQAGIDFIITHPKATTAPQKLSDYKIHENPQGINGWLVEGRLYYDAFVLGNKKNAIYVSRSVEVISIAAIRGITAPVTGQIPVNTITETAQYTGTVTWLPVDATFDAETVYTATITLTPKAGFTLSDVAEDFFTVAGAVATNNANTGVITAVFPATGA